MSRARASIVAAPRASSLTSQRSAAAGFSSHRSGGLALPGSVRTEMERAFRADFSTVRVRVDPEIEKAGALAVADGERLGFAPGQYQPQTRAGRELLGHELAHVVQQRQGRVAPERRSGGWWLSEKPALEREAMTAGRKAAAGGQAGLGPAIGPVGQGVAQMARGTAYPALMNNQYPQTPNSVWTPGRSGPYQVPLRMEAWLTPRQGAQQGGPPVNTKFFLDVNARNPQVAEQHQYHRGHMLARSLRGPGETRNMVPLTQAVNYRMRDEVEIPLGNYLRGDYLAAAARGILHYTVRVDYGQPENHPNISAAERYLPNRVHFEVEAHQGPADADQVGNLATWQATDPEPAAELPAAVRNIPPSINMVLPNFAEAYPAVQPTLRQVVRTRQAAARLRLIALQNRQGLEEELGIDPTPIPAVLAAAEARLDAAGRATNYGIADENEQDPAVRGNQVRAFIDRRIQRIENLSKLLRWGDSLLEIVDIANDQETVGFVRNDAAQLIAVGVALGLDLAAIGEELNESIENLDLAVQGELPGEDWEGQAEVVKGHVERLLDVARAVQA